MSHKRRRQRDRSRKPTQSRRPAGGIHLTTPEGDALVFTNAQYQHASMDQVEKE